MGHYVIFNDKLVINKYDDLRRYSLLVFDKSSWNPKVLRDGFIIRETLIEDNVLFISGDSSVGNTKPFISYDGTKFKFYLKILILILRRLCNLRIKTV